MVEQAESIGLQLVSERDAASGGPVLDDGEAVLQTFERLQLVIGAAADQGEGTLFITDWRIFWLSAAEPSLGYTVDFPAISMHAVAADEESANRPCLYVQLDTGDDEGLGGFGASSDGEEDEGGEAAEDKPLPELRLIPADASQLEALFQAFCDGAERNPDFSEDEEDESGVFYDEDEVLAGAAAAAMGVGDVEELVGEDPGRFEDAEGEEEAQEEGGSGAQQQQPNGSS